MLIKRLRATFTISNTIILFSISTTKSVNISILHVCLRDVSLRDTGLIHDVNFFAHYSRPHQATTTTVIQQGLLVVTCSSSDFVLGEIFNTGGSSKLYRAKHQLFGDVAIKRLKEESEAVLSTYENMIKREARCLGRLNHPNVIRIFGLIWEPGFHALVLEYISPDLFTFVTGDILVHELVKVSRRAYDEM